MFTDPIADYLTRIRNANSAGHMVVVVPASKLKKEITKILYDQGFILSYKFEETDNNQGSIKIALKYERVWSKDIQKNSLVVEKAILIRMRLPPVLDNKKCINKKTTAYVCKGSKCSKPIDRFEDLLELISQNEKS